NPLLGLDDPSLPDAMLAHLYEIGVAAADLGRALGQAAPLRPPPTTTAEPGQIKHLEIGRRDRLGGTLREYQHAA
ncbi:hypothetical protein ACFU6I_48050, partial [Streptomyces sp. NPDC057486]